MKIEFRTDSGKKFAEATNNQAKEIIDSLISSKNAIRTTKEFISTGVKPVLLIIENTKIKNPNNNVILFLYVGYYIVIYND